MIRKAKVWVCLACLVGASGALAAAAGDALALPKGALVEPADLAKALAAPGPAAKRPMLLHVGFMALYGQAHIPASTYAGPTNRPEGLAKFSAALGPIPKGRPLVIYCGCCPWNRCPNVAAAYDRAKALGFRNVKVLHIPDNFGVDWVDKGYPTVEGGQ